MSSTQKPESLRLADKYEAHGFLGDHRFAQEHWCKQAAVELRRQHARIAELEAQLSAIGAGGVEPLRKPGAAPQAVHPESIREGAPYDNPEFEQLARDMGVWGTAQSAVCAQFWLAATQPAAQGLDAQTTRDAVIQHLTNAGVLEHDGCGIFIASGDASELIDACMALSANAHHEKGAAAQAVALLATGGQAQAVKLLAADHSGMKVDYRGLFSQVQRALKRTDPGYAEMLRQLEGHLQELGQRWYAGDTDVVDEILQLYCIESDARKTVSASATEAPQAQAAASTTDQSRDQFDAWIRTHEDEHGAVDEESAWAAWSACSLMQVTNTTMHGLEQFIEQMGDVHFQCCRVGSKEGEIRWGIEFGHYGAEVRGKTLREAIVKAMAAQAKQRGAA